MDHECGTRDPVDHIGGGRAGIVIVGSSETAVVGGHAIVEVSQRFDAAEARGVEVVRKQPYLAAKAVEQLQKKIVFINPVGGLMQSVGARRQIYGWTNRRDTAKFRRAVAAPFPG